MDFAFDRARGEAILVVHGTPCMRGSWAPSRIPVRDGLWRSAPDPNARLELVAGDVPTIGAAHRLHAPSGTGSFGGGVIGLSHVFDAYGLLPHAVAGTARFQRVEALAAMFFATPAPMLQLVVPNAPALLGLRYDSQFVLGDTTGLTAVTNGLELQIGLPPAENRLIETFTGPQLRDPVVFGDTWGQRRRDTGRDGGSGRHGWFSPAFGTAMGNDVYRFDTAATTIPAPATLTGQAEVVTDGRYEFTDFVVPAGTTVEFTGAVPRASSCAVASTSGARSGSTARR